MQKSWLCFTLLLCTACQELPPPEAGELPTVRSSVAVPKQTSPSPSVLAFSTPQPSPTPLPSPSLSPDITLPTATPTVTPRPVPTIIFSPSSSPIPIPTPPAGDVCHEEQVDIPIGPICGNVTGTVYDDEDQPVSGATVEIVFEHERDIAARLNPPYLYAKDFLKTVTTNADGKFELLRYPFGSLSIKAMKPGYSERNISCFLNENSQKREHCDFKRFPTPDVFGYYYDYRLSKKPEVIRSQWLSNEKDGFLLTFSKPVIPDQIQSRILISFFGRSYFIVDQGAEQPIFAGGVTGCAPYCGLPIFDGSFFNVQANTKQDELTFTLKPGYSLPSDQGESMYYPITFGQYKAPHARDIIDLEGNVRSQGHFRLGGKNRDRGVISLYSYLDSVKLESISSHNAGLRLQYDGIMYFKTLQPLIAGGMADRDNVPEVVPQAPAAYPNAPNATPRNTAENYTVATPRYTSTWKALGGTAIYAEDDPLHQQVLLVPPINGQNTHEGLFLSFEPINTAPTSASLNLDTSLTLNLTLVDYTGQMMMYTLNFNAGEASGASGLAALVASKLNALQKGTWQVIASSDQRSLQLTWLAPAVDHVAWKGSWSTSSDQLPTSWSSPSLKWIADSPLARFRSGDNVIVTVRETVLGPDGAAVQPDGRQAQMVWP